MMKKRKTANEDSSIHRGNVHSRLFEGGVFKINNLKQMNLLHLPDSLSAEASEGIGWNSHYVAVIMQVTKQHKETHYKQPILASKQKRCNFKL